MAAFKVKSLWTVFLTAFFAVLTSLGLTAPATAAGAAVQQPAEQPADQPVPAPFGTTHREEGAAQSGWALLPAPLPRDRSLPPTIKQRIRAEAHGSSPSVRHLPVGIDDADGSSGTSAAADENAYAAQAALVAA